MDEYHYIQCCTHCKSDILINVAVDGSPGYFWDFEGWKLIPANRGLAEPKVTLAHSLRAVNTHGKIVVILRSPIDR